MKRRSLLAAAALTLAGGASAGLFCARGWWSAADEDEASRRPGLTPAALAGCGGFEPGDLVLRQGFGRESELLQRMGESPFSHIGIVVETAPVRIVHATTTDDPEHPDQVIASTLEDFLRHGARFALLRGLFPEAGRRSAALAASARVGEPFVLAPRTEAHFYCTTLIEEAFRTAGFRPRLAWRTIEVPFAGGEYLFPEAFLKSPDFVKRFEA